MNIKFIVDYRGRETGENFFAKGDVADLEPAAASFLIQDGRAVPFAGKVKAPKKEKAQKEDAGAGESEGAVQEELSEETSESEEESEEEDEEGGLIPG